MVPSKIPSIDLAELLSRNEGKTLEFKRDLSSPDIFLKTLTAFANSAGGTLLVGVEDGGRRVRGVEDVLKEEERLASLVTDGIIPRLMPEIEILAYRKLQLLAIVVHPSSLRPHHVARMGPDAGTYVRVGPTNRRADRELVDFPDAYLQAGAFAGNDKSKIVDTQEFRDPLPGLNEPALGFINRQLRQGIEIRGARSTRVSEIPPLALREALINALVHTDYSQQGAPIRVAIFDDRIEFENPGLLPFGMTPEDAFKGVSKVRNRVLARVFKELGYIEQWGSGLQRVREACAVRGLKATVLEELGGKVRLTLFRTRLSTAATADPTEQKILEALKAHGALRPSRIAAILKLTPRTVRNRMSELAEKGLVRARGTSSRGPKRIYVLADDGESYRDASGRQVAPPKRGKA